MIDDLLELDEETAMKRLETIGKTNKLNFFLDFIKNIEDDVLGPNQRNSSKFNSQFNNNEINQPNINNKREITTAET